MFGFCQTRINGLTEQLVEIQSKERSILNVRLEAKLQRDLNEWLARMDTIWKQKSREIWLKDGDRNTKFFHLSTIIQRRQNSIDAIRLDLGDWIIKNKKKEIGTHIRDKFKTLFSEEKVSCPLTLVISCALLSHKRRTQIFA